jgi:hypothetical protein
MIQFTKPANLNGTELLEELKLAAVAITQSPMVDGNGDFWLDIASADKTKANSIVAAHNGTIVAPEPTVTDRLASVGLSVTELKAALGL